MLLVKSLKQLNIPLFLLILIGIAFPSTLLSQNTNIEVLKKNLELVDNDTLRMELLIKLGIEYIGTDSEYAIFYLNQAHDIGFKYKHLRGIGMTKLYMGRAYYYSDKYDLAFDYYEDSYKALNEINYLKGIAEYYFFKGALQVLLAEYNNALESYRAGIEVNEKLGDERGKSICLNGIGKIHFYNKNMQTALDYFEESLAIKRSLGDEAEEATVLSNIGEVYEYKANYVAAMKYYAESLKIRQHFGENRKTAVSYRTIGNLYMKTGKYDLAESNFKKALNIFDQIDEKAGFAGVSLDMSVLYQKMGRLKEAEDIVARSVKISQRINNQSLESHAYKIQSEIYFVNEDYKQAYSSLVKHIHLSDSIFTIEEKKQLDNLEARYQIESKNQRIQILDGRNKIQKQHLLIQYISLIAMVLAIVLLISFYRFKTVNLKQKNTLLEREKQLEHHQFELKEKESKILAEKFESQAKELVSKAILMNKTNEIIQQNIEKLKHLSLSLGTGSKTEKKEIADIIYALNHYTSESLWEDFELAFLNVHTNFYDKLLGICPDLTPSEIKMAALLRLNMSSKEIEAITYKSESSIKSMRFRLRKKIGLDSDKNLTAYLMKL